MPLGQILEDIGHDGSGESDTPLAPEPLCRRGFTFEEMLAVAYKHGYFLTAFILKEIPSFPLSDALGLSNRFKLLLLGTNDRGNPHATAYRGGIDAAEVAKLDIEGVAILIPKNS